MARETYTNAAATTLNGAINNSTTSVVVADASTFPSGGNFRIIVDNEIMKVTSRSSNTLTVVRAQEGTAAASHSSGVPVNHIMTAGFLSEVRKEFLWDTGQVDRDLFTLSSDDDDFEDESFSGWTIVQPTPNCTVTEKNHRASVLMPGGAPGGSLYAFLKAKTPSAGDWVQVGMTYGGAVGNYPLIGVMLADGATYGSGKQASFWYSQQEKQYFQSIWNGFNSNSGTSGGNGPIHYPFFHNTLHMRLKWVSANNYRCYVSPDAVSWADVFGLCSAGTIGTPTHMGFVCSIWDNANPGIASFNYCRFSF
jgi:hypothetical protein